MTRFPDFLKRTLATVLASLLAVPFTAAAQSTSTGLSGLGEMRTPDTIPENGSELTLLPARYSVIAIDDNEVTRIAPSLGFTQGWGSRFEAGVQVPFFMHEFKNADSDSGIANVPISAKYRFLEGSRFRFAASADIDLPAASKTEEYGSGTVGLGANLLGTMDVGPVVLSGSLGGGTSDYCIRCTMPSNGATKPESFAVANGAFGVSGSSAKGYGLFLELHGTDTFNGDDAGGDLTGEADLFALAGGRVPLGRRFMITGYGGAGILSDRSNTKAVGALMLHYNFSGARALARTSDRPSPTPVVVATPAPATTPTALAVSTPVVVATPRPTPVVVATPVPKKPLTLSQAALRAKLKPNAKVVLEGVAFTTPAGDVLAPLSTAALSDLAAVLAYHPEAVISLESHVDPTDPAALMLSQARGDAVLAKLQLLGAAPRQVSVKALGGTKSLFPSFVEATKAKNRRIELAVVSPPVITEPSIPVATPVAVATPVRRPLTPAQTALKTKMVPQGNFILDGIAFVSPKGAVLAPAASAPLADLAAVLLGHPEARLRIEGHLDPTDTSPIPLSQQRADAVVAKLKALGVPAEQLESKGMGSSKSLFPSFVEAMKARNRRIEITVLIPPSESGATPGATVTPVTPVPEAGKGRVKVLASKGRSAQAVKLANTLKQAGTKITTIANVPEARGKSEIYYTAPFKAEAEALAKQIAVPGGPKLTPYKTLGASVDIVIVVGADVK